MLKYIILHIVFFYCCLSVKENLLKYVFKLISEDKNNLPKCVKCINTLCLHIFLITTNCSRIFFSQNSSYFIPNNNINNFAQTNINANGIKTTFRRFFHDNTPAKLDNNTNKFLKITKNVLLRRAVNNETRVHVENNTTNVMQWFNKYVRNSEFYNKNKIIVLATTKIEKLFTDSDEDFIDLT